MSKFSKITNHLYKVENQNGLNNALYDYFQTTDNGEDFTKSKKTVRSMIKDKPPYYPISFVIVDFSFECGRVSLEFFDLEEEAHKFHF